MGNRNKKKMEESGIQAALWRKTENRQLVERTGAEIRVCPRNEGTESNDWEELISVSYRIAGTPSV